METMLPLVVLLIVIHALFQVYTIKKLTKRIKNMEDAFSNVIYFDGKDVSLTKKAKVKILV